MRIFVSGGAGFIGSHLVDRFLKDGHSVVAFDNLILGQRAFLEPHASNPKFRFVEADLTDLDILVREMRETDLVVHMAANSDISQGAARTDVDMKNGTVATYNVLESMRRLGIKQIIFASTSAIYGEATVKPTPEDYGPLLPISFYGASKLSCEAMISAFSHNCGIQAWIYRFANIVGRRATHGAIYDFVRRLKNDPSALTVLGDGTQRKSYLHVEDCVAGMLFGYEKAKRELNLFNLASHGVTEVRFIAEEVTKQVARLTGEVASLQFGKSDRGWIGDVPYTHLDGQNFAKLGWSARHDSDGAVRLAISEVIEDAWGRKK